MNPFPFLANLLATRCTGKSFLITSTHISFGLLSPFSHSSLQYAHYYSPTGHDQTSWTVLILTYNYHGQPSSMCSVSTSLHILFSQSVLQHGHSSSKIPLDMDEIFCPWMIIKMCYFHHSAAAPISYPVFSCFTTNSSQHLHLIWGWHNNPVTLLYFNYLSLTL